VKFFTFHRAGVRGFIKLFNYLDMATALVQLEELASDAARGSEQQLRLALSKLALEVNGKLQEGSMASAEYMASVIITLRRISEGANADVRTNCLLDVAQYFYVIGQSFSAIEPALDAVAVAGHSHKALLRKGLTFLGIIYADTGNISRAI